MRDLYAHMRLTIEPNWRHTKTEVWIRFRRRFYLTKQSVEYQLKNRFHIWQGYSVSPRLKQTTFHSFIQADRFDYGLCANFAYTAATFSHARGSKNHLINEYPLWLININFSPPLGNCHCLALLFSVHLVLYVVCVSEWIVVDKFSLQSGVGRMKNHGR